MSYIGLFGGLALLIWLTMRGTNLLIAGPISALLVATLSSISLFPQLAAEGDPSYVSAYMNGFTSFMSSWFFMFLLGAIFGKLMGDCGAAESIAKFIIGKLGAGNAALGIVLSCAILTYGGVSLFIVAFAVYPMAVSLFQEANLPRRFIPAAMGFGSSTFTMTSAGSVEIQNWIPMKYLGTSPYAGWAVSAVIALVMIVLGSLWLNRMLRQAVAAGEAFQERDNDPVLDREQLPSFALSILPLVVVLAISFLFHDRLEESALIVALLAGVVTTLALHYRRFLNIGSAVSEGAVGALLAIANTCAVVGFGTVAKATPAFASVVDVMTSLPGSPLIGAAVAVTAIAGLTGSASGGLAIALPLIAPHYTAMGVNSDALHRVSSIASGALDSLPHNGYVVTTIRVISGETHKDAYPAFGKLTVLLPLVGVLLAILLFILF
ncbi:H+/gluconate symporter-like permease [Kushneria sinocarnis]|uniref:H+/gluconate symporter-like permease n=1 Tax=Kushneria sinocarnis TaxID=595502 RepID=A0A420X1B5_9GAMM|nr:Na+/H+ antiporter NhaC family protein [Kushneria sinocarnis]RKR07540.1 H+/gluconate symporter-like permease [Kushneria sinocarnis]